MASVMHIPSAYVDKTQKSYCCASCWNPVRLLWEKGMEQDEYIVDCATEGCNTPGLVSAKYVEKRLSTSMSEAKEAKKVLQGALGWMKQDKYSVAENLAALGF